ncbi:hypothetical protein [Brevundimonas diminuta]|uniref:hypothetical protein n=1 Tax=Brevundimonas diminuta TaxID=293 RepID=UPI003D9A9CB8
MKTQRVSGTVQHCSDATSDGRYLVVIKVKNTKVGGYSDRPVAVGSTASIEDGKVGA